MVRFPVNYLILEGPDLSGKSTFYNALHKKSSYAWNIQDRSSLSMCVHADQYGRDILYHKLNFDMELLCKLVRNSFIPIEIPVNYYSRSYDEGKKVSILRDGPKAIYAMLKYRLK